MFAVLLCVIRIWCVAGVCFGFALLVWLFMDFVVYACVVNYGYGVCRLLNVLLGFECCLVVVYYCVMLTYSFNSRLHWLSFM